MEKEVSKSVIDKIMERAMVVSKQCKDHCRDFRIMTSEMRKETLILRWTTINIDDIERPGQCFRYECFSPNGISQNCSINYSNVQEANQFFWSLETLHKQEFSTDHKL